MPEAGLPAFLAEVGEALVPPAREFLIRAGLANRKFRFESLTLSAGWEQRRNTAMRPAFSIAERLPTNPRLSPRPRAPSGWAGSAGRKPCRRIWPRCCEGRRSRPAPSCRSTIRASMAAWAAACRWVSCTRSARRGWTRRPPRCPRGSSPLCWRASPRPGRCSGSRPRATCIRLGCCPMGFDPNRLVLVRPAKDVETLAAMEVALRGGCRRRGGGRGGAVRPHHLTPAAACLPASRHHRLRAAPLAAWPQDRGPGGQRRRHPLASHADAQREGRQGTGTAALARGADACPWRPAGRMDHGGFG